MAGEVTAIRIQVAAMAAAADQPQRLKAIEMDITEVKEQATQAAAAQALSSTARIPTPATPLLAALAQRAKEPVLRILLATIPTAAVVAQAFWGLEEVEQVLTPTPAKLNAALNQATEKAVQSGAPTRS
ncbi:MAG: hypothetical protein CMJ39_00160 [Phycisphaerae bacterium]|nr:hypothetical protein [Phycisphaerae bacterium]